MKPKIRKFSSDKDSEMESVKHEDCLKLRDWKVSDIALKVSGAGKPRIQNSIYVWGTFGNVFGDMSPNLESFFSHVYKLKAFCIKLLIFQSFSIVKVITLLKDILH